MFGQMLGTFPSQEDVKNSIKDDGLGALYTRDKRALGTREMRCIYPVASLPKTTFLESSYLRRKLSSRYLLA